MNLANCTIVLGTANADRAVALAKMVQNDVSGAHFAYSLLKITVMFR